MKKMTKKVVIATTTGLASMILNAACGYGPPVQEDYREPISTYGETVDDVSSESSAAQSTDQQNNSSSAATASSTATESGLTYEEIPGDASNNLESKDEYFIEHDDSDNYKIPEVPAVYGPPTSNW
ncbi:hypothetical protein [Butyrivibrio sp. MC2021]|uniref:hypothetical protein n=1 Tax=Butyrivibrio sp. MC2021 TaxID=1408306 RepID=UPI00047CCC9D|nr:hypothetical protein [Butyrivibrio sp. MC2021]